MILLFHQEASIRMVSVDNQGSKFVVPGKQDSVASVVGVVNTSIPVIEQNILYQCSSSGYNVIGRPLYKDPGGTLNYQSREFANIVSMNVKDMPQQNSRVKYHDKCKDIVPCFKYLEKGQPEREILSWQELVQVCIQSTRQKFVFVNVLQKPGKSPSILYSCENSLLPFQSVNKERVSSLQLHAELNHSIPLFPEKKSSCSFGAVYVFCVEYGVSHTIGLGHVDFGAILICPWQLIQEKVVQEEEEEVSTMNFGDDEGCSLEIVNDENMMNDHLESKEDLGNSQDYHNNSQDYHNNSQDISHLSNLDDGSKNNMDQNNMDQNSMDQNDRNDKVVSAQHSMHDDDKHITHKQPQSRASFHSSDSQQVQLIEQECTEFRIRCITYLLQFAQSMISPNCTAQARDTLMNRIIACISTHQYDDITIKLEDIDVLYVGLTLLHRCILICVDIVQKTSKLTNIEHTTDILHTMILTLQTFLSKSQVLQTNRPLQESITQILLFYTNESPRNLHKHILMYKKEVANHELFELAEIQRQLQTYMKNGDIVSLFTSKLKLEQIPVLLRTMRKVHIAKEPYIDYLYHNILE